MINNFEKSKYSSGISGGGGGNDPICFSDAIAGEKKLYGGDMGGGGLYVLADEIYRARDYLILQKELFMSRTIYLGILNIILDAIRGIFSAACFFVLLYVGVLVGYQKINWQYLALALTAIAIYSVLSSFVGKKELNLQFFIMENLIIISGYMWGLNFFRFINLLYKLIQWPLFKV